VNPNWVIQPPQPSDAAAAAGASLTDDHGKLFAGPPECSTAILSIRLSVRPCVTRA